MNNEDHLSITYFGVICLFFMVCLVLLGGINKPKQTILISPVPVVEAKENPGDQRADDLKRFFTRYNSPLADYSQTFIEVADLYEIDWTLLPAIASQESGFGKRTPSCALYNPFGWHSSASPCGYYRFKDFDDAIRLVAKGISELPCYSRFRETGSIRELAEKYVGPSPDEWIWKVNFFQEKIKNGSKTN